MSTHNHLLYFARFCVGLTPKMANKNVQQEIVRFYSHSITSINYAPRLKMAQLFKLPFIVFRLARLIFKGQTNRLDMVYLWHSSFFRIFYLLRDLYTRGVITL